MDQRLFEASLSGNIQLLHQRCLHRIHSYSIYTLALDATENPLHVASLAGHVGFVKEIVRLKPALAKEMNQDGFSSMHIASANGYLEIVEELLKVDLRLCRLKGRDQWTPLHHAARRGRLDIVREIVLTCPESIEDVTVQGETALHLAVKNSLFGAVEVLMELVTKMRNVDILNAKDKHGNTALHLATWIKQHQVVEWLIRTGTSTTSSLEVNIVNQTGLTALDLLLIFPSEAGDREINDTLRNAGALRAQNLVHSAIPLVESDNQTLLNCPVETGTCHLQHPNDITEYFKFKKGRDSPSDARTALLVVAVLVATATFQVGLNPPTGIWQDTELKGNGTSSETAHIAGTSILGSYSAPSFVAIVTFNSIGFSVSLYMINLLTSNFPMQLELQICMVAMYCTYNTAMINIAPKNTRSFVVVFTSVLPTAVSLAAPSLRQLFIRLVLPLVNSARRFIRSNYQNFCISGHLPPT
ncbi:ankyrin repeat-containing protein BDA1-like [Argentina anserina]|uniref:ankyrin repeat-containing protein BDA1-like n=1 Tax=Argentina anserina TaxID=57926 RepID=UPI0021766B77|nr:ankyrin repeat-containing protein BDA1-like [Potentilla anserina]